LKRHPGSVTLPACEAAAETLNAVADALGGFLGATTGPSLDWMPERGYGYEDRQQGLNRAVVYGGFGVALIVVGAVLDAYL